MLTTEESQMANTPTTDLTDYWTDNNNGTSADTAWTELSNYSQGSTPSLDEEAFLQGSNATSQQISANKTGAASGLDYAGTDPAGFVDNTDVFFCWWLFLFPSALNPYNETVSQTAPTQNTPGTASGFFIGIGSSDADINWYAVGGSDFGRYPYGGWQNVAIDPQKSASFTDGTPTASTYSTIGYLPNVISAPSRGQSLVCDAIRWGRGLIQYTGGSPAGTFDDIATENDSTTNRWGLFQAQSGSYLFKGKLELGTTASSLLFSDDSVNINIDDTRQVYSGFNVIEINNASSNITLTSVNISKLKYIDSLAFDNSKGIFLVNDGATVSIDSCTFSDMDTFTFGTNSTTTSSTFNRCGQITQGGSTITDCTISETTADVAVVVSGTNAADVQNITGCTFVGDNTSHAVNLGTITTNSSVSWNNEFDTTTYAATNQAQNATSNPGDSEVILVNVNTGVTLTINVAASVTNSPTYRNTGPGTVVIAVSYDFVVRNIRRYSELRIFREENDASKSWTEVAGVETLDHPTSTSVNNLVGIANTADGTFFRATYQHDGTWGNTVIVVMGDPTLGSTRWQYYKADYELAAENESFQVQQIVDRNKI